MINPNNKEPEQPKLLSGNWINETDSIVATGNFAKELRSPARYQPQSIVGTEVEIEALNKSMEAKAASLEYLKQNYPIPIPNQSEPTVDSAIEAVNHPAHYNNGNIETIDAIAAAGFAEGLLSEIMMELAKKLGDLDKIKCLKPDDIVAICLSLKTILFLKYGV